MRHLTVLIVAVFTLTAVACGGGEAESEATETPRELEVTMRDIAFEPTVIDVDQGDLVRLNFENRGALMHDFTVDSMPMRAMRMSGGMSSGGHANHGAGAAMHLALAAGEQGMIEFEATEPGEFAYYCDEPGHRDAGMQGILRVR